MWHNMFVPELSVAEKILRPIFVYLFLIIVVRLGGRRELAQLNSFDLVIRKQELASSSEAAQAVLETGGAISVVPRRPTPIEERLQILEKKIDNISEKILRRPNGQGTGGVM